MADTNADSPAAADDAGELVARVRAGDAAAFERLIERHRPRLAALIRLRLGTRLRRRLDVEDVLQETLLRAFRGIGEFEWEGQRQFLAWLATIAEHTCADLMRRHVLSEKKSVRREVPLDAPHADASERALVDILAAAQTAPSGGLRREERLERLEQAIEQLPDRHREVILLSLIQRLPTHEVAERLELTAPAVCMLRTRALKKLRELFGDTESLRLPDRRAFEPRGEGEAEAVSD